MWTRLESRSEGSAPPPHVASTASLKMILWLLLLYVQLTYSLPTIQRNIIHPFMQTKLHVYPSSDQTSSMRSQIRLVQLS